MGARENTSALKAQASALPHAEADHAFGADLHRPVLAIEGLAAEGIGSHAPHDGDVFGERAKGSSKA